MGILGRTVPPATERTTNELLADMNAQITRMEEAARGLLGWAKNLERQRERLTDGG